MFELSNAAQVVELLTILKATAVPKSIDSGEELTYCAFKDEVLTSVISLIGASSAASSVPEKNELCVDHQQLANTVLERTFDTHLAVLRQKLKQAEDEADMWRKVSLFGRGRTPENVSAYTSPIASASRGFHVSIGTQIDDNDRLPDLASSDTDCAMHTFTNAVDNWFADQMTAWLAISDKKTEALRIAYFDAIENTIRAVSNNAAARQLSARPFARQKQDVMAARSSTAARRGKLPTKSAISQTSPKIAAVSATPQSDDDSPFSRQQTISRSNRTKELSSSSLADSLYGAPALPLKARNPASSLNVVRAPLNERERFFSQLPQL